MKNRCRLSSFSAAVLASAVSLAEATPIAESAESYAARLLLIERQKRAIQLQKTVSYERNCPDSTNTFVCGESYCDTYNSHPESFEALSSTNSGYLTYNLAAYLRTYPNKSSSLCVDLNTLNDPEAAYKINALKGLVFHGVIKVEDKRNGQIAYIPFKTSGLSEPSSGKAGADNVRYNFTLLKDEDLDIYSRHGMALQAIQWKAYQNALRVVLPKSRRHNSGYRHQIRLRRSKMSLNLYGTNGKTAYPGGSYKAILKGSLNLPWSDQANLSFSSGTNVKFARPGRNNFRLDSRYIRTVSFLPGGEEIKGEGYRAFSVIEIILIPPG
ncbi:hypothetical protein [Endozoicomonas euniceicola]|uniref:Uncharacterized protein n=1 Tax=Endozoicomonas euniceicola TaxID=1234143 RepID=A0ABY6GUL2_9GAMM|nr:hypothetical protein [Endozoicomonas euniceicola]UYM16074.1 hypothetical protein NX720_25290 [Endozoicomonas euniceicola]